MGKKRLKFVVGGVVILLCFAYLALSGFKGAMTYYVTVSELGDMEISLDKTIRVGGKVVEGSIQKDSRTLEIRFRMAEGGAEVPVYYRGVIPDTFEAGADVVVEGRYVPGEGVKASMVLAKCPSKYEGQSYEEHEQYQQSSGE